VWLDAKQESSEMHPRKMVHRKHDYLLESESKQRAPLTVQKFPADLTVKVGGSVAGFVDHGSWRWASFARSRYDDETRDMAKAFVERP